MAKVVESKFVSFESLGIGAVFKYGKDSFVKFAECTCDHVNQLPQQVPNSVNLETQHYCTIFSKSPVILVKRPTDFVH